MTVDTKNFWNKAAPKYARDPIKDMEAYEYTLGRTLSYLGPAERVLEIGCGTGNTAVQIAPHVGEILGTDIAPAMIDIARKRPVGSGNARFEAMTARRAAALSNQHDAVLAFNLLHLLPDCEAVIKDIFSGLPKGGHFISKTVCLADPAQGFKRFAFRALIPVMQWVGKAPEVRMFTQDYLESVIEKAGFEILEAGNFPASSRYIVARKG